MPQPRKYRTNAERQKAYRERVKATTVKTQHAPIVQRVMQSEGGTEGGK